MSEQKMREALARLRLEAKWIERDQHKYAECAYSPSADTLECIADDIEAALAEQPEQPAQGKSERSNRQFLTPEWIAAEDAAGGVMAAGALATSEQPAQGEADVGSSAHEQPYWFPAAARLALDLECLLLDIKDMPTVTRWWDSAHEALEHWRAVVREIEQADESAPPAPAVPDDVAKDAARYRWLRDESRPSDELFMATRTDRAGTYRVSNEMDDIIDAAMLAAAPTVAAKGVQS